MDTPDLMKRSARWRRQLPLKSAVLAIAGLVSIAIWLGLNTTGCDPCASCASMHQATPTATATSGPIRNSCQSAGALGVLVTKTDVDAYVPNGDFAGNTETGVQVVPIEGTALPLTTIPTTSTIIACSANDETEQVVCVGLDNKVYLINGTTLTTTLTSAGSGEFFSSGGSCTNCNVLANAATNQAFIGIATAPSPTATPTTTALRDFSNLPSAVNSNPNAAGTTSGYQQLNLTGNTFDTPVEAQTTNISESPALDPTRDYLLSASEDESGLPAGYQIYSFAGATPQVYDFLNTPPIFDPTAIEFDSAAIDCSTGIALGPAEFTTEIMVADTSKASFTVGAAGANGTWSAPAQLQNFPDFENFSAGMTGIAVAPDAHLALLEDEFGTTAFGALQLPATSGTGTPAVLDWVSANMPDDPTGAGWEMPLDPHGLTAYVSPTTKVAYGLLINLGRTYIAKIDIAKLLAAPRTTAGGHIIDPTFNLVSNGVVTFIAMLGN